MKADEIWRIKDEMGSFLNIDKETCIIKVLGMLLESNFDEQVAL